MQLRAARAQAKADLARSFQLPDNCIEAVDGGGYRFVSADLVPAVPTVVFVNKKSGANRGPRLLTACKKVLHPVQVVDLVTDGPVKTLALFATLQRPFRALVAGGDGSIAWVLQAIDEAGASKFAQVGIIPLGTGNDLARVLGWGPGYDGNNIGKFLDKAARAQPIKFDRWRTEVTSETGESKAFFLNNYFSVGDSAVIAARFDQGRRDHPTLYSSRTLNKAFYAMDGLVGAVTHPCKDLREKVTVECDGKAVTLPDIEDLIVLNIPSYASGTDMWNLAQRDMVNGQQKFEPASMTDGKLELLGVRSSMHMGTIKIGLGSAIKIAQSSSIVITKSSPTDLPPIQVDGEPKNLQSYKRIAISFHNTLSLLMVPKGDKRTTQLHREDQDLTSGTNTAPTSPAPNK